jgi:hypothetical protein
MLAFCWITLVYQYTVPSTISETDLRDAHLGKLKLQCVIAFICSQRRTVTSGLFREQSISICGVNGVAGDEIRGLCSVEDSRSRRAVRLKDVLSIALPENTTIMSASLGSCRAAARLTDAAGRPQWEDPTLIHLDVGPSTVSVLRTK